jgi:hypothetical protein
MITSILLKNFRGHKERLLKFGPGMNSIIGMNEVGKTTINEAISFGFYGCDQYGNRNPDHLITFGEEACEVVITTDKASFTRTKSRNATSYVLLSRNGFPPIKMNQTELTALLGMPFDLFGSLYNAGFFMDLPMVKKLEVIGQIAKLDRRALLQSLVPGLDIPTKIKFENLKVDAQVIAAERRATQNQLSADQGALAQVEVQLREFHEDLASMDMGSAKGEIEALTAQADLFDLYNSDLLKYQAAVARSKEAQEDNARLASEKQKIELELKALSSEKRSDVDLTTRLSKLGEEINKLSAPLESLPQAPTFVEVPEGNCPKCGQMVPPKLREAAAIAREKAINEYNQKARAIEDRNTERTNRLSTLRKEHQSVQDALERLRTDAASKEAQRGLLQKRLASLQPKEIRVVQPPQRPDGDEKAIKEKLAELRAKFHAQQLFSQKKEQLLSREKMFRTAVEQKIKLVENLKKFEEALLKMPEMEVRKTLEVLKTPGVEMMLMDDELVVTDQKRVPFMSLSTGRKLKISVELCKTFQRLVTRAPKFYFIDNVDLMDEYRSILPAGQVFIAKVDPACSDLQVVAG